MKDRSRARHLGNLRIMGLAGYTPAGPVRERLQSLHDRRGITFDTLAERMGVDRETVVIQYRGVNKLGDPVRFCHKATERKILSARFTPADGFWFPALGVRRRLQALSAAGYTMPFLAAQLGGMNYRILTKMTTGAKSADRTTVTTATPLVELYDRLHGVDPVVAGVDAGASSRARTFARKHGYAPPDCWDADTIDDPDAIPEWTGRCGTVFGWRIHQSAGIPACQPCSAARDTGSVRFSGDKLRNFREERGYSRRGLAEVTGLNPSSIQWWEVGRSVPARHDKLDPVLRVLDITYEDVCEEIKEADSEEDDVPPGA